MAEIILDLSGSAGLTDNFSGDEDMITPQPQRIVNIKNGELAGGLFNPYLRKGYLSPISTTSTSISPSGTPDTKLTSVVFDNVNETVYLSDRGTHIYKLDGLTDTSMALSHTLSSGDIIQDLEVYQVNNKRNLYYLYTTTGLEDSLSLASRATWTTTSVEVNPFASVKPKVIASFSEYSAAVNNSISIDVPSGSNIACIVHVATSGTVTSASVDSVAMTLVSSNTQTYAVTINNYIYSLDDVGSGTIVLDFVNSGTSLYNVVFTDNTSATPATVVGTLTGVTSEPVTQGTYSDTKLLLSFLFVDNPYGELSSSPVLTTYEEAAQTGSNGWAIALKSDGTKMYIDGLSGANKTIFQYSLGTAWQIASGVTYDTVSLNVNAQFPSTGIGGMSFNSTGTKMFLYGTGAAASYVIKTYDLGTAWNLSTAVYNAAKDSPNASNGGAQTIYGTAMTSDGTDYYVAGTDVSVVRSVFRYTMSTPFDVSTASYVGKVRINSLSSITSSSTGGIFLNQANNVIYIVSDINGPSIEAFNFDPRFPKDITKISLVISSTGVVDIYTNAAASPYLSSGQYINSYMYYRRNSGGAAASDVCRLSPQARVLPAIKTTNRTISYDGGTTYWGSVSYLPTGKTIECGTAPLPFSSVYDDTWLTETLGVRITSSANHNFIVPADNGFSYIFAGNAVHKIDGGLTGGIDGAVTKDVLLFPETFTLTDAVDFRSKLFIAMHQYPVNVETTSLSNYSGRCGVFIWDRQSTAFGGTDYIEIPGIREIKKIYVSPDGVVKLIVISDSGLTQVRMFGYNDSGGVVFPVVRTIGVGAYPQYPDGFSGAGDKVIWLANDGNLYCESNNAVNILHQVKAPGATTDLKANNIASGITFYGSGVETASSGYRSNKQGILLSYLDTATKYYKKIYPMDITTGSNGAQTPHQGDVYSGVMYIPITSVLRKVRVYNSPITGSGTDVIATVKLYFNQSTTVGMTKSISKDEAKRGYVDFSINKPYIHAIQIEVEWATSEPLGADMYLPSIAVISHDETTTSSPDNE